MALRNWLEETAATINPFDGGKTGATVRAARVQASAPPPATLPKAGQPRRFVPTKDPAKAMQPIKQRPVPKVDTSFMGSVKRAGSIYAKGLERSGVGLLQGASGVVDLVTPGTGTNRVSKKLDQTARNIDADVAARPEFQNNPAAKALYKTGQFAGDAASFWGGGAALKGAGKVAAKAPVVAPVVRRTTRLIKPVTDAANRTLKTLDKGSLPQRVAATTARTLAPANLTNVAANTALDVGSESGKGRDISKQDVAISAATNLGLNTGLPVAGQLVSEGVKAVKPLVRPAVDAAATAVQKGAKAATEYVDDVATAALNVKPHRQVPDEVVDAASRVRRVQQGYGGEIDEADYALYKQLQAKVGGDINDPSGIDRVLQDRQTWADNGRKQVEAQRKAIEKAQGSSSGGYAKIPGATPDDAPVPIKNVIEQKKAQLETDRAAAADKIKGAQSDTQRNKLVEKVTKLDREIAKASETPTAVLPPATVKVKENRLTKRGKAGEQNLSDEAMEQIQGDHIVRNTNNLDAQSKAAVDQLDDNAAVDEARRRLTVELGTIDDEAVAFTNQAIERAQAAGRIQDAVDLHDGLSEHLVKAGQTIQAASLLYRLSPQGMFFKARRDLIKSGTEMTPELEAKLKQQTEDITKAPDEAAKNKAKAILGKTVADNMKKGVSDKLLSVWKAGLLSGQKTFQGGVISNTVFAGLKKISDVPAALADTAISVVTNKRTKAATLRGGTSGAIEGVKKGWSTFRTGIDERNQATGGKFEQHGELNFKNPVINAVFGKTSNQVFRTLSAADQPFYFAAAKNNLYDQAIAKGKTQGLYGKKLQEYVKRTADAPDKVMAEIAKKAAEKAVLGYDTIGSKAIQGIHSSIDRLPDTDFSKAAKATAHTIVGVLAPFVRVPTAFISRTIDFTPAGPFKEIIGQISRKQFDQRALSEAIGQGMTGTGVIALGVALSQADLLSGDYPKTDPKEAARWKAEGITPNSVKLYAGKDAEGKDKYKWVSLNYFGPIGLLFNAGRQYQQGDANGAASQIAAAAGGLGQGLMGQSFLQGFSGFSDAIQDPERNAKSFLNSQASSLIPAWSNDLANATDEYQRQADTVLESVKNRVPGARQDNKIKQDVYGNDLKQAAGQLNTLNAAKPSDVMTDKSPAVAEVARLHSVDPDNKDLQVTPSAIDKKLTVGKTTIKLDNDQRYELQKRVGQDTQERWGQLIATKEYQALNDADKAKALVSLRQASQELTQREYVESKGLASYDEKLGRGAQRLKAGNAISRFAKTGDDDGELSYMDKYEDAKAEFDADSASWSPVERVKKTRQLRQLTIQKDYDTDLVSLYGMGKADVYGLLSTDPNGKAMAKKLLEYGDKLEAEGIGTNKFRDSKGNEAIRPKEKKTGGSGSGRGTTSFSLYSGPNSRLKYDKTLRNLVNAARLG